MSKKILIGLFLIIIIKASYVFSGEKMGNLFMYGFVREGTKDYLEILIRTGPSISQVYTHKIEISFDDVEPKLDYIVSKLFVFPTENHYYSTEYRVRINYDDDGDPNISKAGEFYSVQFTKYPL